MADPTTTWTATDPDTDQFVAVSGDMYSVNGTEPRPIPDSLMELAPHIIARELLREYLGYLDRRKDDAKDDRD